MESRERKLGLLAFDPADAVVGTVRLDTLDLRDGWNELAIHRDSGARLWANAHAQGVRCYRVTDELGTELDTLHIEPAPDRGSPNAELLKDPTRDP